MSNFDNEWHVFLSLKLKMIFRMGEQTYSKLNLSIFLLYQKREIVEPNIIGQIWYNKYYVLNKELF